jgi:putative acetyltransferase
VPALHAIRATTDDDHDAVLALVGVAFSDDHRDGQEEVDIVLATWALGDAVDPIDLVAVADGAIVGHVLGARGSLGQLGVIAVAPLAVTPAHQRQGVGTLLMTGLLQRAEAAGWPMAVLLGNPAYYSRFGFEPSGPLGISYSPVGEGSPHFQVKRLGSYDTSCRGSFTYCWEQR